MLKSLGNKFSCIRNLCIPCRRDSRTGRREDYPRIISSSSWRKQIGSCSSTSRAQRHLDGRATGTGIPDFLCFPSSPKKAWAILHQKLCFRNYFVFGLKTLDKWKIISIRPVMLFHFKSKKMFVNSKTGGIFLVLFIYMVQAYHCFTSHMTNCFWTFGLTNEGSTDRQRTSCAAFVQRKVWAPCG